MNDTMPAEINSNDFKPLGTYLSNSNQILSSRELIILSDSNFWCVWGSCAVCCGLFSHEARHTARTQHSTDTQQKSYYSFIFNVVVSSMIHDNMYVYFP